jgi:hypothetical protein
MNMKCIFTIAILFTGFSVFAVDNNEDVVTSIEKIDRAGIKKVFFDHQKDLTNCYDSALAKAKDKSTVQGKMVLDFTIDEDGSVLYMGMDSTKSTLKSHSIAGCVVKKAYTWTFPKPPAKQMVQVYYPLSFSHKK